MAMPMIQPIPSVATAVPTKFLDKIPYYFKKLDNNMYIAAIAMVVLNTSAKYIPVDFGKGIEKILTHPATRKIAVFCIFYMATRNFGIAMAGAVIFYILVKVILNEKNKFNLLPKSIFDINNDQVITPDEVEFIKDILKRAKNNGDYQKFLFEKKRIILNKKFRKDVKLPAPAPA